MRKFCAIAILLFAPSVVGAELAGTVKTSKGDAHILRDGQELAASPGQDVRVTDSIRTGNDGTVGITLLDDTRLTAGPDSTLELRRFVFNSTTQAGSLAASVSRGSLSVISGKIAKTSPEQVSFSTPSVTLGVRGTRFIIKTGK